MRSWGNLSHYNRAAAVAKVDKLDETALGLYAASEYGLIFLFVKLSGVLPPNEPSGAKIYDVDPSFFGDMDPIQKERLRARDNDDKPRITLL